MIRTSTLVNTYMLVGGIGLACCFLMHHCGQGDARYPITLEYSRANPLAFLFFLSAVASASLLAWLFRRGGAKAESLLLAIVAVSIGVLMATPPDSVAHFVALLTAVLLAALAPMIFVLQSEMSFVGIILYAIPMPLVLVAGIGSFSSEMGLGIAERLWYGANYFTHAMIIKMMADDGRLDDVEVDNSSR